MDFGVVSHKQASAEPRDEKGHGSVSLKHQRSGLAEDCWKSDKILKSGEVDFNSIMLTDSFAAFGRSNLWPPDEAQKMLSFSSPVSHCGGSGRSIAFSISQDESNIRSGGGGLSGGVRGTYSRLRGPFTPSQWMELEHQALIYKHIVANVPVPSNLLVPLKRSLYSYGLPGSYGSNFLGWGPFHLGFSGSNDPEPGRCRRTDGKKWRCSRDAVPDQKYCERHINRGRHRSRKPVEGQTGHAVSGSIASKVAPIASSPSASVISSSSASNSLSSMQHPFTSLQPNTTSTGHLVCRGQGFQDLSLIPPTNGLVSKDGPFSIQKQHIPFKESSETHSGFGTFPSDFLRNHSEKISYPKDSNSDSLMRVNTQEANGRDQAHHFIEDWPKDQSDRGSTTPWPEELKSEWTQLSMSIRDFSSSLSSPAQEKPTQSSLRLAHEIGPIHMSLGVSHDVEKQSSWAPVIWVGGPLGEVLSSTTSGGAEADASFMSAKACRNSPPPPPPPPPPHLGSSPTGVLQKSTFVSVSNSSTSGGSPTSVDNSNPPLPFCDYSISPDQQMCATRKGC